jgi:hypothetical protein
MKLDDVSFHAGSINVIRQTDQAICMLMDDVQVRSDDKPRQATVKLAGVREITSDDISVMSS